MVNEGTFVIAGGAFYLIPDELAAQDVILLLRITGRHIQGIATFGRVPCPSVPGFDREPQPYDAKYGPSGLEECGYLAHKLDFFLANSLIGRFFRYGDRDPSYKLRSKEYGREIERDIYPFDGAFNTMTPELMAYLIENPPKQSYTRDDYCENQKDYHAAFVAECQRRRLAS